MTCCYRSLLSCLLPFMAFAAALSAADPAQEPPPPKAGDIGTFIEIGDDLRVQLYVEERKLMARFVDPEDTIVEAPVESILFIVDDPGHREDEWRTVLKPVDGESLFSSPRRLYGPYNFRARIIIRFTDREPSTFTNHSVDLQRNL